MTKTPLIIDVDPGIDDTIALLILSNYKEKFDIKLMCSTAGNCSIDITTKNTLFLSQKFFDNVPVAKGDSLPLSNHSPLDASDVHSAGGLGNYTITENINNTALENSYDRMAEILRESDEKITIVSLGAMTNIAKLLINHPNAKDKIKNIYAMIGSIEGKGNITPDVEFNAYFDPEAFEIVSDSGVPIVFNTLELGLAVTIKKQEIYAQDSKEEKHNLVKKMIEGLKEAIGESDDTCQFDANSIISLIRPELYEFVPCDVYLSIDPTTKGKSIMIPNPNGTHKYLVAKDLDTIKKFILDEIFHK